MGSFSSGFQLAGPCRAGPRKLAVLDRLGAAYCWNGLHLFFCLIWLARTCNRPLEIGAASSVGVMVNLIR